MGVTVRRSHVPWVLLLSGHDFTNPPPPQHTHTHHHQSKQTNHNHHHHWTQNRIQKQTTSTTTTTTTTFENKYHRRKINSTPADSRLFLYASEACIFMSKTNIASVLYIEKSTHHFTAWTLYSLQLRMGSIHTTQIHGATFAQRKRLLIDKVLFPAKHRSQMYGNNCNSGHSIGLSSIRKRFGSKCW